jgi:hypothetical protein
MTCFCPDFYLQIHDELCTNLDGSNPSFIHGWKYGEVYFHMQLTAHHLELCRMSYPCFSEHWSRTLLLSNWAKTNPFTPTRRDVPSINSTPTPPWNSNHEFDLENREAKCSCPLGCAIAAPLRIFSSTCSCVSLWFARACIYLCVVQVDINPLCVVGQNHLSQVAA